MVISSDAKKQIMYCDNCLDDFIKELNDFEEIFGKKTELKKLKQEIVKLKTIYKQWDRKSVYPYPGKNILKEAEGLDKEGE